MQRHSKRPPAGGPDPHRSTRGTDVAAGPEHPPQQQHRGTNAVAERKLSRVPSFDFTATAGAFDNRQQAAAGDVTDKLRQPLTAVAWLVLLNAFTYLHHQLSFLHNTGLFWLITTFGTPTNQIMLAYRTVAQDLQEQPCNEDRLAPELRDALMPRRLGAPHDALLLHIYRWFLESPLFGCPGIITFVDARTRWFDEEVAAALDTAGQPGGFQQVVAVAAGYCTRAYRMQGPSQGHHSASSGVRTSASNRPKTDAGRGYGHGVLFFEVDLPGASSAKQHLVQSLRLQPPGQQVVKYVAADLSVVSLEEALQGTGFDPRARTLFTCEGLLYYLPEEAVEQLLGSIARLSMPGSRVVFDFLEQDVLSLQRLSCGYHSLRLTVQNKGEQLKSGLNPCPYAMTQLLSRCGGLHVRKLVTPRQMAQQMAPGRKWSSVAPPLPDFFHYCVAEKW